MSTGVYPVQILIKIFARHFYKRDKTCPPSSCNILDATYVVFKKRSIFCWNSLFDSCCETQRGGDYMLSNKFTDFLHLLSFIIHS